MARMPGARWRPIQRNYTGRRTTKTRVILHTTASASATSMHGWFSNPNAGASSHFHIDNAGNIEQYIDTDYISWANRDGNSDSVTIETQGAGHEPWTAAQVRAIVRVIQWARTVHKGIPLRQMTSSAATQKGIGWHRLGVNGNFPRSGILRGRQQRGGGELWSAARGKICPGDDRIKQIPAIIRQAGGHATPATAQVTQKGLTMSDINKILDAIKGVRTQLSAHDANSHARHNTIREELPQTVWEHPIGTGARAQDYLYGARMAQYSILEAIREIGAQEGLDTDKLEHVINTAVKNAVDEGIDVVGTVQLKHKGN